MKQTKQRNNHARSKRKRALLLLKNKMRWILNYRAEKAAKYNKPKGITITGKAKDAAVYIPYNVRSRYFRDENYLRRNQRKRRKLERQNPHLRLK